MSYADAFIGECVKITNVFEIFLVRQIKPELWFPHICISDQIVVLLIIQPLTELKFPDRNPCHRFVLFAEFE